MEAACTMANEEFNSKRACGQLANSFHQQTVERSRESALKREAKKEQAMDQRTRRGKKDAKTKPKKSKRPQNE